jgi:SRSO17 transposase
MSMDVATVRGWEAHFDRFIAEISGCFGRCDLLRRASAYIRGLLGPVQRKNGWQLAEYVGDVTPHGIQRLLDRARWDADDVRDTLLPYARAHLLTEGDHGVLIVDETGFLKKGDKSVGVQRQYSGTAGRIENSQVGVFLALASSRGRALIDRELYLPKSWCEDQDRMRAADVPPDVRFVTKPQLAQRMIERVLQSGLHPRWVLGDEVYGSDSKTRRFLDSHGQPYVLAVSCQQRLWRDCVQQRVDKIADEIPTDAWRRISVADGAKGPRVYDWAAGRYGARTDRGLVRWLLIRRSIEDATERAYYLCTALPEVTVPDLAIAAGQRWAIECCFESAKQETGLDNYEVRSWHGWYRHVTLSMAALALLTVIRVAASETISKKRQTGTSKKADLIWSR